MADKAEKKPDAAPAAAAAPDKGGAGAAAASAPAKKGGIGAMLTKMPVMLGGVMIIEAAVLFAGFKFLGGGGGNAHDAKGATLETDPHKSGGEHGKEGGASPGDHAKSVELAVVDFKAQNKQTGATFIYDVSVYVVAKSEFEARVKETITRRGALIKDRIRTIIAQTDPEKLGGGSEPGLETLRRQVKHQLDEIIGEGMIEEVLVPRCIPFRTDF
jgi:flagellar basal body-associated protein FliL